MPENFTQYLILLLIGLLFGKEYILAPILKKIGLNGKNGDTNTGQKHRSGDQNERGEKEIEELRTEITTMRENHLHEISGKLDRLIEEEMKGNKMVEKVLWNLEKK